MKDIIAFIIFLLFLGLIFGGLHFKVCNPKCQDYNFQIQFK